MHRTDCDFRHGEDSLPEERLNSFGEDLCTVSTVMTERQYRDVKSGGTLCVCG